MELLKTYIVLEQTFYNLEHKALFIPPEVPYIGGRGQKCVIIQRTGDGKADAWLEDNVFFQYQKEPALVLKAI